MIESLEMISRHDCESEMPTKITLCMCSWGTRMLADRVSLVWVTYLSTRFWLNLCDLGFQNFENQNSLVKYFEIHRCQWLGEFESVIFRYWEKKKASLNILKWSFDMTVDQKCRRKVRVYVQLGDSDAREQVFISFGVLSFDEILVEFMRFRL